MDRSNVMIRRAEIEDTPILEGLIPESVRALQVRVGLGNGPAEWLAGPV